MGASKKKYNSSRNLSKTSSVPSTHIMIAQLWGWRRLVGVLPYITSAKGLDGCGQKVTIFADVKHCCIKADIAGGSEKVQKYTDVV